VGIFRTSSSVSIHAPARGATSGDQVPLFADRCFNPRPCARGDNAQVPVQLCRQSFNPRPCARGDTWRSTRGGWTGVSIHAPARGATSNFRKFDRLALVSIHAPARGATILDERKPLCYTVSIHAPARGATDSPQPCCWAVLFQSTPLREGRRSPCPPSPRRTCFNPRPCARGDRGNLVAGRMDCKVSIHAPARGATPPPWKGSGSSGLFQSTPLREGRPGRGRGGSGQARGFNPRPCARGDRGKLLFSLSVFLFQSTPLREGRLERTGGLRPPFLVSIHAPARGATASRPPRGPGRMVSIHAPARGATQKEREIWKGALVSIHAPARGATRHRRRNGASPAGFNPRPCARGDGRRRLTERGRNEFQSTPLREGRLTTSAPLARAMVAFQSTPLREGRLQAKASAFTPTAVSIHAPARGATSPGC